MREKTKQEKAVRIYLTQENQGERRASEKETLKR